MTETLADSSTPPESPPARHPPPMAVSLVSILVAVMAMLNVALGALALAFLMRTADMSVGAMLRAPVRDVAVQLGAFTSVVQPSDVALRALVGVVDLLLLFGFRRLRRWAWVGLMTWATVLLAFALARYVALSAPYAADFVTMATQSVIVLSLNAEVVRETFGIDRPPPGRVPVRGAQPASTAGPR